MKSLEKGEDKIQKLCDALRKETIEPAKREGSSIIEDAREEASQIIHDAEQTAEKMVADTRATIEQERNVFHSSLEQAASQSMEALRQSIEKKLFNAELDQLIKQQSADPKVIARIIEALIKAVEKEGVSTDLTAVIPQAASTDEVNALLGKNILDKLKEKSVTIGHFDGGAQVKVHEKRMTIDMTDAAIKELVSNYVRKDFRKLIFGHEEKGEQKS